MAGQNAGASTDAPVFFTPGTPRWGLCCQFLDSPIKFRQATHRYCATLSPRDRRRYLAEIVLSNATALNEAIDLCSVLGIGAFRITSQMLPLATHPESGYTLRKLLNSKEIIRELERAREAARRLGVRLSFHPDQFVVLNSETERVVVSSLGEMNHQAEVAELIGAEALTLHAGGRTGGVSDALIRLEAGIRRLGQSARALLALENDDRLFSPADLLPFCERTGIPFIYDVHHHRCHPDGIGVAEASERAAATWQGREPWMHLSSPKDGWESGNPRMHAGYIDPADVPGEWKGKRMTIDVEAKEKERAVIAIRNAMSEGWAA